MRPRRSDWQAASREESATESAPPHLAVRVTNENRGAEATKRVIVGQGSRGAVCIRDDHVHRMRRTLLLDVTSLGCGPPAESWRVPRGSVHRRGGYDMHKARPTMPQSHAAQLLTPCPAAHGCRPWTRPIPCVGPPTDELPRSLRIANDEDARVDVALRRLLARKFLCTTTRCAIAAAPRAVRRPGKRPGSRCVAGERDEGAIRSQRPRRSRLDSNPNVVDYCVGIHENERTALFSLEL
eukprot:4086850-Prymnesium_polylepis.2